MKIIIGILIIVMILFSGCASVCVPVDVKEKILNNNGDMIIIDEHNIAYEVQYVDVYDDIKLNETNYLNFMGMSDGDSVVTRLCDEKVTK